MNLVMNNFRLIFFCFAAIFFSHLFCVNENFKLSENIMSEKTKEAFVFPKPTGPHAVGTFSYYLKDESHREIHSDNPDDKRELMIQFWYPAVAPRQTLGYGGHVPAQGEKQVSNIPYDADSFATMLNTEKEIPFDKLSDLKKIYSYSTQKSSPLKNSNPCPVVLFAPGFSCTRNHNTANCEELASHGYVVVGIDPTYAAYLVKFPDERKIRNKNDWKKNIERFLRIN